MGSSPSLDQCVDLVGETNLPLSCGLCHDSSKACFGPLSSAVIPAPRSSISRPIGRISWQKLVSRLIPDEILSIQIFRRAGRAFWYHHKVRLVYINFLLRVTNSPTCQC